VSIDRQQKEVILLPINVINIRDAPKGWRDDPSYVYIGRAGRGMDGYFGNPFPGSGGSSLPKYREYFLSRLGSDPEFKRRVLELDGKTLVCFCKPSPCHGDVIKEWVEKQKK